MNYSYYDQTQVHDSQQFFTLKDLTIAFWRGRWIIIGAFILAMIGAFVYLSVVTPVYVSTARILIDPRQIDPLSTSVDARGYSDLLVVDSQIEVMRSRALAERAMEDLKLFDQPPASDDSLLASVKQWLGALLSTPEQEKEDAERTREQRVNNFMKHISVERVRLTYAISISFSHSDPQFAADAANALANGYLEDQLASKFESVSRSREWVDQQLESLRADLDKAKIAANEFRAQNNLVVTQDKSDTAVQQLGVLGDRLGAAKAETAQAKALMDRMDQIIASGDPDQSVPDMISSRAISDLREKYADLAARAAEIEAKQGPQHQVYIDTMADLERVRGQILEEMARIDRSYKNAYEIALANETAIQDQINSINGQIASSSTNSVKLAELDRRVASVQAIYDSLLDSSNKLAQQESVPITEARVVDKAIVPPSPSSPQSRTTLILAALAGLMLGFGIVGIRAVTDDRIWTQGAIERLTERPSFGMIPKLNIPSASRSASLFSTARNKIGMGRNQTNEIRPILLQPFMRALSSPSSAQLEVMRSVNMYLSQQSDRRQAAGEVGARAGTQVITFSSVLPGEGKTSTSLLYAAYLAKNGVHVLMADLDYRRPGLSRLLAPNATHGLFDLPEFSDPGARSREGEETGLNLESIRYTGVDGLLELLPGQTKEASMTLMEEKLDIIVERVIAQYSGQVRAIIFDLPPILSLPDLQTVVKHLDATILVAEWGRTEKYTINMAKSHAPQIFENLSGSILNKARTEVMQIYGAAESRGAGYYYK